MLNKMFNVIVVSLFVCSCTPQKAIQIHADLPSLTFSQFRLFLFQPAYISEQLIVVELGIDLPENKIRDTIYALDYELQWHASIYAGRDTTHGCDHNRFYYAYKNIDKITPDSILLFTIKPFKPPGFVYHQPPITSADSNDKILTRIAKSFLDTVFKLDSNSLRRCNNNPDTILTKLISLKDTIYKYTIECTEWNPGGGISGNELLALIKIKNDTAYVLHKYYANSDELANNNFNGYLNYLWVTDLDNDGVLEIKYQYYQGGGYGWRYIGQLIGSGLSDDVYLCQYNNEGEGECNQYPAQDSLFMK